MAQIQLQSSDGRCFAVDVKTATLSKTIKTMLEELGTDGLEKEVVPLPNVDALTLEKILEWADHHKGTSILEEQEDDSDITDLSDWDKNFLEVERTEQRLFDIILAANYLDINPLLNACCKFTALMIKGKNVEEIREIFKIKTPEGYEKPAPATDAATETATKASPMETEEKAGTSGENKLDLTANDRPGCSTESS